MKTQVITDRPSQSTSPPTAAYETSRNSARLFLSTNDMRKVCFAPYLFSDPKRRKFTQSTCQRPSCCKINLHIFVIWFKMVVICPNIWALQSTKKRSLVWTKIGHWPFFGGRKKRSSQPWNKLKLNHVDRKFTKKIKIWSEVMLLPLSLIHHMCPDMMSPPNYLSLTMVWVLKKEHSSTRIYMKSFWRDSPFKTFFQKFQLHPNCQVLNPNSPIRTAHLLVI